MWLSIGMIAATSLVVLKKGYGEAKSCFLLRNTEQHKSSHTSDMSYGFPSSKILHSAPVIILQNLKDTVAVEEKNF